LPGILRPVSPLHRSPGRLRGPAELVIGYVDQLSRQTYGYMATTEARGHGDRYRWASHGYNPIQ
jgi:hypothetical protein